MSNYRLIVEIPETCEGCELLEIDGELGVDVYICSLFKKKLFYPEPCKECIQARKEYRNQLSQTIKIKEGSKWK